MKKKVLRLIFAAAITCGLVACGNNTDSGISAFGEKVSVSTIESSAPASGEKTSVSSSERSPLSNAQVGSYVYFGSYEQDNNNSNGKENIEWLVLEKEDNRMLVISKYALDFQPYNDTWTEVTWETCSLRKWLNGKFLDAAFSTEEKNSIISSTVSADYNPKYDTPPGNNTTDKVFLLSITEANKYFSSDSARQCQGTAYCYAQGADESSNGNCWWWLRSPGYSSDTAADVREVGYVSKEGEAVHIDRDAVRPALWINLGS